MHSTLTSYGSRGTKFREIRDHEHTQIKCMHQNLRTAIVAGAGMEKILKCSADLITATLLHFESEERVMSEYAPLSLGVHRDLHSELIGSLEGISTDLERRSISGAMELLKFFDGRLTYHLDFEDAALERELSN